jgi:hypothetical protein
MPDTERKVWVADIVEHRYLHAGIMGARLYDALIRAEADFVGGREVIMPVEEVRPVAEVRPRRPRDRNFTVIDGGRRR